MREGKRKGRGKNLCERGGEGKNRGKVRDWRKREEEVKEW